MKGLGVVVFRHGRRETLTSGVNRANAEAKAMWSRALLMRSKGIWRGGISGQAWAAPSPERARKSLGVTGLPGTIDSGPGGRERGLVDSWPLCRTRV